MALPLTPQGTLSLDPAKDLRPSRIPSCGLACLFLIWSARMRTAKKDLGIFLRFLLRLSPNYDIIYFGKLQGLQEFLRAFLSVFRSLHTYTSLYRPMHVVCAFVDKRWMSFTGFPKSPEKTHFRSSTAKLSTGCGSCGKVLADRDGSSAFGARPPPNMQRMQTRQAGIPGVKLEYFPKDEGRPHACGWKHPLFHMLSFAPKPGKSLVRPRFPQHPHPLYLRRYI